MSKMILEGIGTHETKHRADTRMAMEEIGRMSMPLAALHARCESITATDLPWGYATWRFLAGCQGDEYRDLSQHLGSTMYALTRDDRFYKAAVAWERKCERNAKQRVAPVMTTVVTNGYRHQEAMPGTGWGMDARISDDLRAQRRVRNCARPIPKKEAMPKTTVNTVKSAMQSPEFVRFQRAMAA